MPPLRTVVADRDAQRLLLPDQDTEAAVVVVERDTLDQPGDFFGHGSAFWDCGIHVRGFIFARRAGAWVNRHEPDFRCFGSHG